jgi:glyoxylase I family protein
MPPPFKPLRLDHVVLRVRDMERTLTFYRDVIGAELEREIPEVGMKQLRAGASIIDLVPAEAGAEAVPESAQNMDHLCLRIEPWSESVLAAHFSHFSVPVEGEGIRYGAEGNGPSIYVRDPEGNVVELKGPPLEP